MDQIAEGRHCRLNYTTVFIVEKRRLHDRFCAVADGEIKSPCGIAARKGDVSHRVPMQHDVIRDYARGARRFRYHQTDALLLAHKRHPVAHPSFETAEGHRLKAEGGAVKVNRLLGIADIEFDEINSIESIQVGVWQGIWFCSESHINRSFLKQTRAALHLKSRRQSSLCNLCVLCVSVVCF